MSLARLASRNFDAPNQSSNDAQCTVITTAASLPQKPKWPSLDTDGAGIGPVKPDARHHKIDCGRTETIQAARLATCDGRPQLIAVKGRNLTQVTLSLWRA